MTPLEAELNWERVWNFVVMDAPSSFYQELMIPQGVESSFHELRRVLTEHYSRSAYGEAPGALHISMVNAMKSRLRAQSTARFLTWCESVCILYNDRVEEFFWNSALYGVNEVDCGKWIDSVFDRLEMGMKAPKEALSEKLSTLRNGLSDEDLLSIERMDMSIDALVANISLTCTYNIFVQAWRTVTAQFTVIQLTELYGYGKALARKRGIPEASVSFPGMWDYRAGP